VKVFENISVIKSLHHGDIHESTTYDTSVIAKREDSGPIELFLAENKQPKMYESACSSQIHIDRPRKKIAHIGGTEISTSDADQENIGLCRHVR
jgi:hypothetical protein